MVAKGPLKEKKIKKEAKLNINSRSIIILLCILQIKLNLHPFYLGYGYSHYK